MSSVMPLLSTTTVAWLCRDPECGRYPNAGLQRPWVCPKLVDPNPMVFCVFSTHFWNDKPPGLVLLLRLGWQGRKEGPGLFPNGSLPQHSKDDPHIWPFRRRIDQWDFNLPAICHLKWKNTWKHPWRWGCPKTMIRTPVNLEKNTNKSTNPLERA